MFEYIMIYKRIKMKKTAQQPLYWKWNRPIDNGRKVHFA